MRGLFQVLILSLAFSGWSQAADWSTSGLGLSDLKSVVNDTTCESGRALFQGCVEAVNVLLASGSSPLVLMPEGEKAVLKPLSKPASTGDAFKDLRQAKLASQALLGAWTAVYQSDTNVLFDDLVAKAVSGLKALTPQTLANAINAYYGAARDPHTYILPRASLSTTEPADYSGVGVDLEIVQGQLVVEKPHEGSPALKAGVRANDILEAVDGVAMAGLSLDDALKVIRGPAGTTAQLVILRGAERLTLAIVRQTINVPNVSTRVLNNHGVAVGVVRINTFDDVKACDDVQAALTSLVQSDVKALVLDLRENLGGIVGQAVCIAGLFVGPWQTVAYLYTKSLVTNVMGMETRMDYGDETFVEQHTTNDLVTDLPLVLLVNAHSASASEILAGALQDDQRAILVGDRTYGKGTFQQPGDFPGNPGIVLMETGGRFYMPTKRTNQLVGIQPDLEVYATPHPTEADAFALREADLYTNALPAEGDPWVEPRPALVATLKACAEKNGDVEAAYVRSLSDAIPGDYQLLYGESAAACLTQ